MQPLTKSQCCFAQYAASEQIIGVATAVKS